MRRPVSGSSHSGDAGWQLRYFGGWFSEGPTLSRVQGFSYGRLRRVSFVAAAGIVGQANCETGSRAHNGRWPCLTPGCWAVPMVGPLPEDPRCSYFLVGGSELMAQDLLSLELSRIKEEFDQRSKKAAPKPEEKVFTVWLMPVGGEGPHGEGDRTPIHLPWMNRDLLATMLQAEVESLYLQGGMARVDEFVKSVDISEDVLRPSANRDGGALQGIQNAVPITTEDAAKAGRMVREACDATLRELKSRIAKVEEMVEPVAVTLALGGSRWRTERLRAKPRSTSLLV